MGSGDDGAGVSRRALLASGVAAAATTPLFGVAAQPRSLVLRTARAVVLQGHPCMTRTAACRPPTG